MLFHMCQFFSFLLGHRRFSVHFFFTFMEQLFDNHPISTKSTYKVVMQIQLRNGCRHNCIVAVVVAVVVVLDFVPVVKKKKNGWQIRASGSDRTAPLS